MENEQSIVYVFASLKEHGNGPSGGFFKKEFLRHSSVLYVEYPLKGPKCKEGTNEEVS